MNLDRAVLGFAGVMTLASLALAHFVSPLWLWFTAAIIFRKLGVRAGCAFK